MGVDDNGREMTQAPRQRELTVPAVLLGLVLSVVMGAANVYLGLRAGMTVSASIPAAVIAMGVLHGVCRRRSVLESNLVQTAASAGESLAAGVIFTIPALVLLGVWETFHFWTTSLIALAGGILGVVFMIPMRRVFVVESPELKFPEGVACAEVLRVGEATEAGETGAGLVFVGILLGALLKLSTSFLNLLPGTVETAVRWSNRAVYLGVEVSAALVGVGYIVGLSIAAQVSLGGAIGWLVALPMLAITPEVEAALGAGLEPGQAATGAEWTLRLVNHLWSTQVRYMGVGAMVVGGIASIWHVRRGLVAAVRELFARVGRSRSAAVAPTERNMGGLLILGLASATVLLTAGVYYNLLQHTGITAITTLVMVVMAFFFTAVASYLVGLVGASNSPVSGMTITAVLGAGALLYLFGYRGTEAMVATLGVAGVVCCVACTSGDVCNDLKTGHLVGASPRLQQHLEVLGVAIAAFVMAPVLVVLHEGSLKSGTGGIGGRELPAPQAKLFQSLAEGIFGDGRLPWDMVGYGVGIAVLLLVADGLLARRQAAFRLHVMPVAVGIYLPFGVCLPMLIGGFASWLVDRMLGQRAAAGQKRGMLAASGVIAGESLIGVLLGLVFYLDYKPLEWGGTLRRLLLVQVPGAPVGPAFDLVTIGVLVLFGAWMYRSATARRMP